MKNVAALTSVGEKFQICWMSGFSLGHFVAAQDALPTQDVAIRHPGNETIFVVLLGTAGTNPILSNFDFNLSKEVQSVLLLFPESFFLVSELLLE